MEFNGRNRRILWRGLAPLIFCCFLWFWCQNDKKSILLRSTDRFFISPIANKNIWRQSQRRTLNDTKCTCLWLTTVVGSNLFNFSLDKSDFQRLYDGETSRTTPHIFWFPRHFEIFWIYDVSQICEIFMQIRISQFCENIQKSHRKGRISQFCVSLSTGHSGCVLLWLMKMWGILNKTRYW